MRTLVAMAAVTIAVGGLVGCGDDDDSGERLSKAELISEGDAICAQALEETGPLFAELFPTGSETPPADEAAGPMGEAAEILRQEYDDFSALEPPEEDQAAFDEILEGFEAAIEDVERSAELAADGDTEGYLEALGQANESDAASRELMADYGFTTCAGETEDES